MVVRYLGLEERAVSLAECAREHFDDPILRVWLACGPVKRGDERFIIGKGAGDKLIRSHEKIYPISERLPKPYANTAAAALQPSVWRFILTLLAFWYSGFGHR